MNIEREQREFQTEIYRKFKKMQKWNLRKKPTSAAQVKQWQRVRAEVQAKLLQNAEQQQQQPHGNADDLNVQRQLTHIIDAAMVFQQYIMELGESINRQARLQLLFIFIHASLRIVFNTYNMVVYIFKFALQRDELKLGFGLSMLFYCYHVFAATLDMWMTIIAFSSVYDTIAETARIVNKLNLYVSEGSLRMRLTQFVTHINTNLRPYSVFGLYYLNSASIATVVATTATYTILLMQSNLNNELSMDSKEFNKTSTNSRGRASE